MASFTFDRRQLALGLSGALLTSAARAQSPEPPEASVSSVFTVEGDQDALRRLTAPMSVDDQGPFRFAVDTGANRSVISTSLARRLGLPPAGDQLVHGVAGAELAPTVRAEKMAIGHRTRRDVRLSVFPDEFLGVDGILGLEWVEGRSLVMDFVDQRLLLGPVPYSFEFNKTFVVKAKKRADRLSLVRASVIGGPVTAFLDSGSYATVANPALLAMAAAKNGLYEGYRERTLVSVSGARLQGRIMVLKNLVLGGMRLSRVPVTIADTHVFKLWGLDDKPAILVGVDVLRAFDAVALDFQRSEVSFRLPGELTLPT